MQTQLSSHLSNNKRDRQRLIGLSRIWAIHSTKGDGNCLFRAISHQLYSSEEHNQLVRHFCVLYLYLRREFFARFVMEEEDRVDEERVKKIIELEETEGEKRQTEREEKRIQRKKEKRNKDLEKLKNLANKIYKDNSLSILKDKIKNKNRNSENNIENSSSSSLAADLYLPESPRPSSFITYLNNIHWLGVWGDDLEIQALSELYGRPIEIWTEGELTGEAIRLKTFHEFDYDLEENSDAEEEQDQEEDDCIATDEKIKTELFALVIMADSIVSENSELNHIKSKPGKYEKNVIDRLREKRESQDDILFCNKENFKESKLDDDEQMMQKAIEESFSPLKVNNKDIIEKEEEFLQLAMLESLNLTTNNEDSILIKEVPANSKEIEKNHLGNLNKNDEVLLDYSSLNYEEYIMLNNVENDEDLFLILQQSLLDQ